MTSEVFKLKGLSEQVKNDFIKSAEENLEAHLAKEVAEKAKRGAAEAIAREATKKAAAEAAVKEKVEVEPALAAEVT